MWENVQHGVRFLNFKMKAQALKHGVGKKQHLKLQFSNIHKMFTPERPRFTLLQKNKQKKKQFIL